jgi:hypothetical protein
MNLTVSTLNLTCLRESEQQHNKYMKHYVACKMRHLITNLAVPELNLAYLDKWKTRIKYNTPDYLLLDPPLLMATLFFLTHATHSLSFGVI